MPPNGLSREQKTYGSGRNERRAGRAQRTGAYLTLDWRKSFQRAADCRHGTTLNRIGKYFIHWDFLNIMDNYGQ